MRLKMRAIHTQFRLPSGPQQMHFERDIATVFRDVIGRIQYTYADDLLVSFDIDPTVSFASFAPYLHNDVLLLEVELLPNFSYEVGS